ncbi:adenosine 5'-monophosphoramidase HINT3-like [Epinephelus lanceolatus]
MAKDKPDSNEEIDETCIFCLIANEQDKETRIIKKNMELVCFRDIWPAAPHHYLVVPIEHIHSCFSLHQGHIDLVERMAEMGRAVLHDRGITDTNDMRLGFHQPPFTSVDHLHLHVLAPASKICKYLEFKFIPRSYRFVTESSLRQRLKGITPPVKKRGATNMSEESLDQNELCAGGAFCLPCLGTTTS